MKLPKFVILLFLFLITVSASSQFTVNLRKEKVNKESNTLFNINLAYTGSKETEELQIKLTLNNSENKTIYEVLTPFLILTNKEILRLNSTQPIAQTFVNELTSDILPDGKYEVIYRENKSNKLLKRSKFMVSGDSVVFNHEADSGKTDLKKWIPTTGKARLTSAFNNPKGIQSEQKNYYSRLEFNPTVVLGGQLPIMASVLLTTEQNASKQPMNQVSVSFDYNYFKTLQEQKALSKIEAMKPGAELEDMNKLKTKYLNEKNKGYDALKTKLNAPESKEILAKTEEYNSLEKQKANMEKELDRERMEFLKRNYEITNMDDLEARKNFMPEKDYKELKYYMTLESTLEEINNQMKNLESANAAAKKLQNQKEKLDKIESTDYMEMMRDPAYKKQMLNKLGMNGKGTRLIGSVKNFSIGTTYPLYTELTMNGVRSTGFNIEINPGIFYAAFTKGVIQNSRYDTSSNNYEFQRNLMAGRLGIGKKEGTHFILSYINTEEKGNPFSRPTDNAVFNPGHNLIGGADLQISMFKQKFIIGGEVNAAITTKDKFSPAIPENIDPAFKQVSDILAKVNYKPNFSTRADYAYTAKTEMRLFKANTLINGYYTYIGAGYTSYTAPYLFTDILKYEGKLTQSFWKKRISMGGYYKFMSDNLSGSRNFKTTLSGYGAEFALNIPKFPSLFAKYLPVNQVSDFSSGNQTAKLASNMIMAGASYGYSLLKAGCSTQIFYNQYDIKDDFFGTNMHLLSYLVSHNMAFSNGMNYGFNGFFNTSKDTLTKDQSGYGFTGTGIIKKKLIANAEVHYLKEGSYNTKKGFMMSASYKIIKNLNAQLRFTYNSIKNETYGNRTEVFGNFVLSATW